jgi:hypothetical protein
VIITLAFRNLVHDRVRLVVTWTGVVFAVVLITVQLRLFLGLTVLELLRILADQGYAIMVVTHDPRAISCADLHSVSGGWANSRLFGNCRENETGFNTPPKVFNDLAGQARGFCSRFHGNSQRAE